MYLKNKFLWLYPPNISQFTAFSLSLFYFLPNIMILNMVSIRAFFTFLHSFVKIFFLFFVHCFLSFHCKNLNSCSWEISMTTSENSQPPPTEFSSSSPIAYQPSSPYFLQWRKSLTHFGLAIVCNRELSNIVQWPRHSQPRTIWVLLMDPF